MKSRIQERFAQLAAQGRKALVPFVTAGDPDLDVTIEMIRRFDRLGCAVCEVGIPYSDPIADGPVIQASYTRALDKKITLSQIFQRLGQVVPELEMPVVTMVSYAIVFRHGIDAYLREAKAAGISGLIVPDLLVEDAEALASKFADYELDLIQLVTPTTPKERAQRIAKTTTGFLYFVSITGITGERTELPAELTENLQWMKQQTELPICVGFGISHPEQVRVLAPVADGVIVGSAIVRRLADAQDRAASEVADEVEAYVASLLAELKQSPVS